MGVAISKLSAVLKTEGADPVYLAGIGHAVPHLHIHLIPRWPETPTESKTIFRKTQLRRIVIRVETEWKPIPLKYSNVCDTCGTYLPVGSTALWSPTTSKVRCLEHPVHRVDEVQETGPPLDRGKPGASALAKYEWKKSSYEKRFRVKYPRAAGLLLATRRERPALRAWRRGAQGETAIGKRLEKLSSQYHFVALHDRRIPNSWANIDHIAITRSGVYVIDTKYYKGEVRIQRKYLFDVDEPELRIGKRNRTHLVAATEQQTLKVREVLVKSGENMPVTGILAFYRATFPILRAPESYRNVLINSHGTKRIVSRPGNYTVEEISRVAGLLANSFPVYVSSKQRPK